MKDKFVLNGGLHQRHYSKLELVIFDVLADGDVHTTVAIRNQLFRRSPLSRVLKPLKRLGEKLIANKEGFWLYSSPQSGPYASEHMLIKGRKK